jgi:hypothetical protein
MYFQFDDLDALIVMLYFAWVGRVKCRRQLWCSSLHPNIQMYWPPTVMGAHKSLLILTFPVFCLPVDVRDGYERVLMQYIHLHLLVEICTGSSYTPWSSQREIHGICGTHGGESCTEFQSTFKGRARSPVGGPVCSYDVIVKTGNEVTVCERGKWVRLVPGFCEDCNQHLSSHTRRNIFCPAARLSSVSGRASRDEVC